MKTHDRETGDPGCRAVILKHFCSTASFWKLKTFITPLITGKQVLRGAYAVGYVDIFQDGVAYVQRHVLLCECSIL